MADEQDSIKSRRWLDGSGYALQPQLGNSGGDSGVVMLTVVDAGGAQASVALDRDGVRRLIADATEVGGLRQVSPMIARSSAAMRLAAAMQINLALLADLHAIDPVAAGLIASVTFSHLRSWLPSLSGEIEDSIGRPPSP